VTLGYEGGMSTVKTDPGNWTGGAVGKGTLKGTKYGIAASAFPNLDIANLTVADVQPIYQQKYWTPIKGELLPAGVDLATYDYGVNSGPARSSRDLQSVVGVWPDGIIGPATLKAVAVADGKATIQKLCAKRLGFLQHLKIWNAFKRGWSSRVASVEAKAVSMFLSAGAPLTADNRQALLAESDAADKKATTQASTAGGATAASGGTMVTTGDHSWLMIAGAIVIVVVIVGVLVVMYQHNKARAAAYAAEAKAGA
jgi:lysozyme family protein